MQVYDRKNFQFMDNFIRIHIPYNWVAEDATKEKEQKTTEKIKRLMKENPTITNQELAILCGITEDGVYYNTKKMQKNGEIVRIGGRKTGHWEVL